MREEPLDKREALVDHEPPERGDWTAIGFAAAGAIVGAANWTVFLLAEHGVTFGLDERYPAVFSSWLAFLGLALLGLGTMLGAIASVPRGSWPWGAAAVLVNLSLPFRMLLRWDFWRTMLWAHVVVSAVALVMLLVYRRRWAAGQRDERTRRVKAWALCILLASAVVAVCILLEQTRVFGLME